MSSLFLVYKLLEEGIFFLLIPGRRWNYGNTLSYFYPHWKEKFGMFSWTFKCFRFYPSLLIISSSVFHTEKSLTLHLRILFLFHFIAFPYRAFLVWVIIYWGHVRCFLLHRSIFHPKFTTRSTDVCTNLGKWPVVLKIAAEGWLGSESSPTVLSIRTKQYKRRWRNSLWP